MATTGGKADMERIGLFQEMGYTSIGAPYVPPSNSMILISSDNFNIIPGYSYINIHMRNFF